MQKLPFSMRCRWRRNVDEITEVKRRMVTFPDLANFLEKEARIANHPVFGNISTVKPPSNRLKFAKPKPGGSSFGINTEESLDLPQVSLEWVLIGYIQFIMRSVLNLKRRTRETCKTRHSLIFTGQNPVR